MALKKIIAQMEQNATAVVKKGRSSFDKKNWTGIDYANDHKIREYCREKIWPIYSRLSEGWNVYSENNRSLCARIMAIVDIEPGRSLKGLWLQSCAPSVNRLFIDMMSKETASCKKQFKGKWFYEYLQCIIWGCFLNKTDLIILFKQLIIQTRLIF